MSTISTNKEQRSQAEFDVLVLCARTTFDASCVDQLKDLLNEALDWRRVLRLSLYHGVYPFLYHNLTNFAAEEVPPVVLQQVHRSFLQTAARNLLRAQELGRISRLFESNSIPLISFKGPVLAEEAYQNLALRPCTDVDILVEAKAFDRVEELLIEDGYRPAVKQDMNKLAQATHKYLAQQIPFVRDRTHSLDVHLSMMPPGYYYPFSFDTLLARSHVVSVGKTEVRSFEPEDLLHILCYHGVKNRWERLKHICDVAECVRAHPELDWDVIMQRAQAARGEGILHLGLYLAHTLVDTPLPPEVRQRVIQDKRAQRFGTWLIRRLPDQMERGMAGFRERMRFYLGIQDTMINKVRYSMYALLRRM